MLYNFFLTVTTIIQWGLRSEDLTWLEKLDTMLPQQHIDVSTSILMPNTVHIEMKYYCQ